MIAINMTNLERTFIKAKEENSTFFGILVRMKGFITDEVIINHRDNFDSKLEYYKKTYDENLNHKFSDGISIIDFTYGNSFEEIQDDLIG